MIITSAIFLYSKAMVLYKGSDVTVIANPAHGVYTTEQKFTASDGLFVAAALTPYDSNTEIIEEARYGELVFEHYGWGNNGVGNHQRQLDHHYCSESELGLSGGEPSSSIFPIFGGSQNIINIKKKQFKCVSSEDLVIWGDYNSDKAQQINVKFKMCEGHSYCEKKEDIQKWLQRKFIILVYNQIRFNPEGYSEDTQISESRVSYIPISGRVRQTIPFSIQITHLYL